MANNSWHPAISTSDLQRPPCIIVLSMGRISGVVQPPGSSVRPIQTTVIWDRSWIDLKNGLLPPRIAICINFRLLSFQLTPSSANSLRRIHFRSSLKMQTPNDNEWKSFYSRKHTLAFLSHNAFFVCIKWLIMIILLSLRFDPCMLFKNTFLPWQKNVSNQLVQFIHLCIFFFFKLSQHDAISMQDISNGEQSMISINITLMLVAILSCSETKLCTQYNANPSVLFCFVCCRQTYSSTCLRNKVAFGKLLILLLCKIYATNKQTFEIASIC